MDFTNADIQTFKKLYKEHFNIRLSDKLAILKLAMLVRQFEIVYQPITEAQLEKLNDEYGNDNNEQSRSTSNS